MPFDRDIDGPLKPPSSDLKSVVQLSSSYRPVRNLSDIVRNHSVPRRVNRRLLLGTNAELEEALFHPEDSSTLNTSFIERHNLTIRQGCSYLARRTPCHARSTDFLEGQVALLMPYYNFLRPHRALKFGTTIRTPAMQAGLAKKRLSFRDVFTSQVAFFLFFLMLVVARYAKLDLRSVRFGYWRGNGSTTLAGRSAERVG